ncbi:MAG: phosphate ABC transporter permease PstA [Gemmataceae bacterium]
MMGRIRRRQLLDNLLTLAAVLAVLVLATILVIVLGPIIGRGYSAISFHATVEFRKMQFELHNRGDEEALKEDMAAAEAARKPVYDLLDSYNNSMAQFGDQDHWLDRTDEIYDTVRTQLREKKADYAVRKSIRGMRSDLRDVFRSKNEAEQKKVLALVLANEKDKRLEGTDAYKFFELAQQYKKLMKRVPVTDYQALRTALKKLFGPRLGEPKPKLAMQRFGVHRMDLAEKALDNFLYDEQWVSEGPGKLLVKKRIPRQKKFEGTDLEHLFPLVENNLKDMLRPEPTYYWSYFLDDSIPGHYFGGVGPEILGTLLVTLLAVAIAFPIGVVSAAFLTEVASQNLLFKLLRMCINTLAGVPSIVFGLFGLAFFVYYVTGKPCVFSAALTLAVLILPVIIRASEEAIRAVPQSYKEAALGLGASRSWCFLSVQFPAALPGILTGVILSIGRAAGETAPILFTGAVAVGPALEVTGPNVLWQQTRMLSYSSYDMAVSDRVAAMVPHQQYGMVATLIVLVLLLNLVAIGIRWRISARLRGG